MPAGMLVLSCLIFRAFPSFSLLASVGFNFAPRGKGTKYTGKKPLQKTLHGKRLRPREAKLHSALCPQTLNPKT